MPVSAPIRVMIVDDHSVVRSGLCAFLLAFEDLELVGEASSGADAVRVCRELRPDVVLMDLVMPGMNGAEATEAITEMCPDTRVVALTSYKDEELVQAALKAGAISYLLKSISAEELYAAIREAHVGRSILAPEAAHVLIQAATREDSPVDDVLTVREITILELMVEGLSNPDIARRLVVSRSTVKFHVSNILMKLGASTRTEAVALALQHGLVKKE